MSHQGFHCKDNDVLAYAMKRLSSYPIVVKATIYPVRQELKIKALSGQELKKPLDSGKGPVVPRRYPRSIDGQVMFPARFICRLKC